MQLIQMAKAIQSFDLKEHYWMMITTTYGITKSHKLPNRQNYYLVFGDNNGKLYVLL